MMTLLPTGFRDRLPPEADAQARLVRAMLDAIALFGYERVQPPLAEFEAGMTGSGRDRLRFVDPVSGETMAVRADITGQVGRIAASRMAHHPRPVRLSYAGPVVKLKASQLRPEREMMQAGAELIGSDGVAAASEIVSAAISALKAAGVEGITVDLTMPDLVDVLVPGGDAESVKARLDAKDAAAVPPAFAPLIAAAGPFETAIARLRAFDTANRLAQRIDDMAAIAATIPDDVAVTLDPTERHGFEYQTWFGFSLFADGIQGEVGRGGAYRIGDEAAVGFSVYVDPLVDAGLARGERRRLFVPFGTDATTAARLRSEGWVTVTALDASDTAEAQICTHVWSDGVAAPV
jgi:ATP phosphoribosyltransferase regulatory subunit